LTGFLGVVVGGWGVVLLLCEDTCQKGRRSDHLPHYINQCKPRHGTCVSRLILCYYVKSSGGRAALDGICLDCGGEMYSPEYTRLYYSPSSTTHLSQPLPSKSPTLDKHRTKLPAKLRLKPTSMSLRGAQRRSNLRRRKRRLLRFARNDRQNLASFVKDSAYEDAQWPIYTKILSIIYFMQHLSQIPLLVASRKHKVTVGQP